MKTILLGFFALLTFVCCTQVRAETESMSNNEIELHTRLLDVHAQSIVAQTEIALHSISKIIRNVNLNEKEGHELLAQAASEIAGVRAIIFISATGALTFDSFSYPTPDVNLQEREYFQSAMANASTQIRIGKPTKGKTSSIPFLPLSVRVEADGKFFGVLAAIITPSYLVNLKRPICLYCVAVVTDLEGEVLGDHPAGLTFTDEVKQKLYNTSRPVKGTEVIKFGALNARVYWIRNEEYPFISIFLEFIRR